ncbi:LacI family DNA-binding transcriptional regulator [Lentzea terrae]|jgi:DNA-binding LacI/PurR family transcriptional regulator|uniref:LacI family DNA-binding transcriptional regulator n=1 Tax=Lentzea terrae TaxID=2200761 RepID=UPI000DD34D3F|nr:LacI family DNA-binding transcriptional regulator [Lentzea terrae]
MITIKEVARHAGVSMSTVSYVLSGKRSISGETRRRVEQSIAALGYHPNAGARALASSKSQVLGLVVPLRSGVNMPVIMQFVASIVSAARDYDYDVLLLTKEAGPGEAHRVTARSMADAIILMDVESDDLRIPELRTVEAPVVLLGMPDDHEGLSCVDLDFATAGRQMAGHLADRGHRSIALIGSPPAVYERGTSYAARLLEGFRSEAAKRDVRASVHPCAPGYDAVAKCLDQALAPEHGTTGLVVHNEAVLGPLLLELRRRSLDVPADLSVITLCPDDVAESLPVPLTSIAVPAQELGTIAVEMVMARLTEEHAPEVRLLQPRLTDRGSTSRR